MTEQPWWRRLGGLPPRWVRLRERRLTALEVWTSRISLAVLPITVLWGLLGHSWWWAFTLLPATIFSIGGMPEHQRRQVLRR